MPVENQKEFETALNCSAKQAEQLAFAFCCIAVDQLKSRGKRKPRGKRIKSMIRSIGLFEERTDQACWLDNIDWWENDLGKNRIRYRKLMFRKQKDDESCL